MAYRFLGHRGKGCGCASILLVHSLWRWECRLGGLGLLLRRKRLTVSTIEHHTSTGTSLRLSASQVRVGSMRGHERLRLRGNRREHALLVETDTVVAASVLRILKSRTPDLQTPNERPKSAKGCPSPAPRAFRQDHCARNVPFVSDNNDRQWRCAVGGPQPGIQQ